MPFFVIGFDKKWQTPFLLHLFKRSSKPFVFFSCFSCISGTMIIFFSDIRLAYSPYRIIDIQLHVILIFSLAQHGKADQPISFNFESIGYLVFRYAGCLL